MPRWVFLAIASLSGISALGFAYLARLPLPERGLVAVEPVHDFGQLGQGDKVGFDFTLINQFELPIKIRNVITSCGCTSAICNRSTMDPGEKMKLSAEWSVGASRDRSGVRLTVIASLPGGEVYATSLQLTATVVPDIVYQPAELVFSRASPVQRVVFSAGRMRTFTLKQVYCTHKAFKARLLPDGLHVEVTYKPDAVFERIPSVYLVVDTTSMHEPTSRIPLRTASGRVGG